MAEGLPSNNIRAACRDSEGTLWVGGDGNRLSSWTGSGFISYPLESLPAYGSVRAMLCSGGVMWIGTTNGLIRREAGRERLFTSNDGLADNWIHCLLEGRDGTLWIGTNDGFSRLRNDVLDSYRTKDGLSQSTVYALYEDREGNLWVGTKHGLNQFLDGRTIPYTVCEGLPTNDVGPVIQDKNGAIWIGTIGAGLCRFEDSRHFQVFTKRQGLAGNDIYALAEGDDGSLWIGTNAGLNRLRNGRVDRTYTTAQGLPENRIQFLSRDRAGVLWIGTAAGLAMLQGGRLIRPKEPLQASHPLVLGGGEDNEGHFFFEATETGLKVYLNREFHDLASGEAPFREVDTFYVEPNGLLWMGTLGSGLRLLKDGKATSYFMRDGLFDNEIYGIVEDGQDRLWMASSKGIFSVSRSDLLEFADKKIQRVVSTPYSPLDGLRTIECKSGVQPAVWKMNDGTLWFSTIRGLLVIDTSKLSRKVSPPVVIEDVSVNGESENPDSIQTLAPGRKDLQFRYTALTFFAPAAVNFRYILDGYDTNWINAATRRTAYYTNLPPGKFRFRVMACDVNGLCSEDGSSVAFTLASHYYQSPWFLPFSAAFLTLAIWFVWRQRVRMLKQQFEIVLAERNRIARELHDTLLQGFAGITMGMQAVSVGSREGETRSRLEELIYDAAHCLKQSETVDRRSSRREENQLRTPRCHSTGCSRGGKEQRHRTGKLNLDQSPSNLPAEVELQHASDRPGSDCQFDAAFRCDDNRSRLELCRRRAPFVRPG